MGLQTKIYNASPVWLQNVLCSLHGRKILKERFNDKFRALLQELNESQFADAATIQQYKEEHIAKILEYAYTQVPFYKEFYDAHKVKPSDFKGVEDLRKFPVLTKELVRANAAKMVATDFPQSELIANHTSGSSGKALDFFGTRDSVPYQWAIWWRLRNRFDVAFGEKSLNFTGKIVVPMGATKPPYWRINKPLNQWLLNMQQITPDKAEAIADMINAEEFSFFSGYPSIIHALALILQEKGLQIIHSPRAIFTGAEKMYDDQRATIEQVFGGAIITDHYGTSEGVVNATKCKCGVYHEDYEMGHIECEEPHWISETEYEGDILGTGFTNLGMPFIRYKIGDSAVWSTRPCACGLHSQVITDIQGRSEDYVLTPEGLKVKRFDYLFKETKGIKECQVEQRELGKVVFRIVKRADFSQKEEEKIKQGVKAYISPTMECEFEYVDAIERTVAGKFKAVVSRIS